jgi:glycosyltransferase domain-containing protein
MQGNYDSEHAAYLRNRLTIVLISHNRPAFLYRAIQYYSAYPCRVMVLDSSLVPMGNIDQFPMVDYHHLPQYSYTGIQEKIHHGLTQITTPYMVFAADDDFLQFEALTASVDFMDCNPDYSFCHGYCLMYVAHANRVGYYRRDKKVQEDYSSPDPQERVLDYLSQFIPPFYAVTRTELQQRWSASMQENTRFEWGEISHAWFMLANGKARILPIPYIVRELNIGSSEHDTDVITVLGNSDNQAVAEREQFAEWLALQATPIKDLGPEQGKAFVLESFAVMFEALRNWTSLTVEFMWDSTWTNPLEGPTRKFGPRQYVEMPFYNQAFFDQLTAMEFLIHAMPAGRIQLKELEGVWVKQAELLSLHDNDTDETITARLWQAFDHNPFDLQVVDSLAKRLDSFDESDLAEELSSWAEQLQDIPKPVQGAGLPGTLSGRLLNWLDGRGPEPDQLDSISAYMAGRTDKPQFGILLLDLDNDIDKLQATLDSLVEGHCKSFKIVVFTTGEPLALTTAQNTLHFVRVTPANYIDKLNQVVRQSTSDWMLLVEAGDQFTKAGLLRASLELLGAPECRAVAADEIQRQEGGELRDVLRPGFNLDLLQSVPGLMARHWLIRRDVLLDAGGYSAEFKQALEFELLLRIIEQGGLSWLAHMDEPLLICQAASVKEENADERQALLRHLTGRGYRAQVMPGQEGTWHVDYRHVERPLVSIILVLNDNLELVQRCLNGLQLRTRYSRHEVLVTTNAQQSSKANQWLEELERQGGRVRVIRSELPLNGLALQNLASTHARGEYLILLAAEAEVVNANWLELLLNQAQRPEVGVVGGKLIDGYSVATQTGLILGMHGGVGSAFVGADKDAHGYMNRLIVEQNYSAVSGACLMVRKSLFDAVEGLDEGFVDGYSDVDLCLKVGQLGFLTVWTPKVQVIHPGNLPDAPQALAALREKWAGAFDHDLAYNKNLALTGKGFTLDRESRLDWAQLLA